MARTIDAHHHFWETAAQEQPWRDHTHTVLERDFAPGDLVRHLKDSNVDATVLVQSADQPDENDRLSRYARSERVAGVVAWLPLRSGLPALSELSRVKIPKLCGVRCLTSDDPLTWLADPSTIALFQELATRNLVWDVVPITSGQVRSILRLAHAVPELKIVIDHLARPPLDTHAWEPWASHIAELAACPNVAAKVSIGIDVLTSWKDWTSAPLEPYVDWAYKQFGADRLMLASNWPVVLVLTSYTRAWRDLVSAVEKAVPSPQERSSMLGGTAEHWYCLHG